MSGIDPTPRCSPSLRSQDAANLAVSITRDASKQTYYTIRLLVDRNLVPDAFRAYAYFRWLDDLLDAETGSKEEKIALVNRQQSILELGYAGISLEGLTLEEQMLVDLVRNDREKDSGLRSYLTNMMAVMIFDTQRRGRFISQSELSTYTRSLATAVTDALHHFIGHDCQPPHCEERYLAVNGAHIVHMLRDALEDAAAGYYNFPGEFVEAVGSSLPDIDSPAYREWVKRRVQQAREDFRTGREAIRQVKNLRCRLAGFAYTARFEWMLRAIERDGYRLRRDYPERKSLGAGLWMVWMTLTAFFAPPEWSGKLVNFG